MTTILVVDQEPRIRALLGYALRQMGFSVHLTGDSAGAAEILTRRSEIIDLVLLADQETLVTLRRIEPKLVCGFLSANLRDCKVTELLKLGAVAVFQKPIGTFVNVIRGLSQAVQVTRLACLSVAAP